MNVLEARKRLNEIHEGLTCSSMNKVLFVVHGDMSTFMFTTCYYVVEGNWLFVFPEHQEQQMFHVDDCRYVDVTDL